MSDAEWDADDFEPPKDAKASTGYPVGFKDKWEGEDEDDNVKADWDASSSEEEDSKGSENSGKAVQVKKKKKLHEILAEKEAKRALEEEEKAAAKAAQEAANTPEAKLAEKLRAQKIAEAADLQMARELMGGGGPPGSIDGMVPTSKDEFEKMSKAISEKIQLFKESKHYENFVEGLIKDLALDLTAPTLKQVKIHVETLHSTKVREQNAKSKGKGKKGSTVKMDLTKDMFGGGADGGGFNEMDDFM